MATIDQFGRVLTSIRPLLALATVWLTTAGHTMNFREMNAAHGWISAEGYALHSIYLLAVALTLPIGPVLSHCWSPYRLTVAGLTMLAAASFANGFFLFASWPVFVGGRVLAGIGGGLVLFAAPRLIDPSRTRVVAWSGILLPALGPPVIAGASQLYGWSSWEGGFLFEGVLAVLALAMILSLEPPTKPDPEPEAFPWYVPVLATALMAIWFLQHRGQLDGWFDSPRVLTASIIAALALAATVWLLPLPGDGWVMAHLTVRFGLAAYAGFVQFFNVSDMGVYGGLLVNLGPLDRSLLVWSISLGTAAALILVELFGRPLRPRWWGALIGLLIIAAGMHWARLNTLNWPFWSILNTVEFNWFAAPLFWELGTPRFLMGFGTAIVLYAALSDDLPDPDQEARVRPRIPEVQLLGGALSIGVLSTFLLVGHQWEYSYAADRGSIQAQEVAERTQRLADVFTAAGDAEPQRQADVLMFRAVNYQADNWLFADIYGGFTVASLTLAACLALAMIVRAWWRPPSPSS